MADVINQKIAITGDKEVVAALNKVGAAGKTAFDSINKSQSEFSKVGESVLSTLRNVADVFTKTINSFDSSEATGGLTSIKDGINDAATKAGILKTAFDAANAPIEEASTGFSTLALRIGAVAAAAVGLRGLFIGVGSAAGAAADEIRTNAEAVGLTVEQYQRLAFAAKSIGTAPADFDKGILEIHNALNKTADAAKGMVHVGDIVGQEAVHIIDGIAVTIHKTASSVDQANGKLGSVKVVLGGASAAAGDAKKQLDDLAQSLRSIPEGKLKAEVFEQLKKSIGGGDVLANLEKITAAYSETSALFDKLGLKLSDYDQTIAQEQQESLTNLKTALGEQGKVLSAAVSGIRLQLGLIFTPIATVAQNTLLHFIEAHKDALANFIGNYVTPAIQAIKDFALSVSDIDLSPLTTRVTAALSAVEALFDDAKTRILAEFPTIGNGWQGFKEAAKHAIDLVLAIVVEALGWIRAQLDAFGLNSWDGIATAAAKAWEKTKLVTAEALAFITSRISEIKIGGWSGLVTAASASWETIKSIAAEGWAAVAGAGVEFSADKIWRQFVDGATAAYARIRAEAISIAPGLEAPFLAFEEVVRTVIDSAARHIDELWRALGGGRVKLAELSSDFEKSIVVPDPSNWEKVWEIFVTLARRAWDAIKEVSETALTEISAFIADKAPSLVEPFNALKEYVIGTFKDLASGSASAWAGVALAIIPAVAFMGTKWETVALAATTAFGVIRASAAALAPAIARSSSGIVASSAKIWNGLSQAAEAAWRLVVSHFSGDTGVKLGAEIFAGIGIAWQGTKEILSAGYEWLKSTALSIEPELLKPWQEAEAGVKEFWDEVAGGKGSLAGIISGLNFIGFVVKGLGDEFAGFISLLTLGKINLNGWQAIILAISLELSGLAPLFGSILTFIGFAINGLGLFASAMVKLPEAVGIVVTAFATLGRLLIITPAIAAFNLLKTAIIASAPAFSALASFAVAAGTVILNVALAIGQALIGVFAGPALAAARSFFGALSALAIRGLAVLAPLIGWPALLVAAFALAGGLIYAFWDDIKKAAGDAWTYIETKAADVFTWLTDNAVWKFLKEVWGEIATLAGKAWDTIKGKVEPAFAPVKKDIEDTKKAITDHVTPAVDGLKDKLNETAETASGKLSDALKSAGAAVWGVIGDAGDALQKALGGAAGAMDGLEKKAARVRNGFKEVSPGRWSAEAGAAAKALGDGFKQVSPGHWITEATDAAKKAVPAIVDAAKAADEQAGKIVGKKKPSSLFEEDKGLVKGPLWEDALKPASKAFQDFSQKASENLKAVQEKHSGTIQALKDSVKDIIPAAPTAPTGPEIQAKPATDPLAAMTQKVAGAAQGLKQQLDQIGPAAFSGLATAGETAAQALKGSFSTLAEEIRGMFQGAFADLANAAKQAWDDVKSYVGTPKSGGERGSGPEGTAPAESGGTETLALAGGGLVRGSGSGVSDSVPIAASAGEYMVKRAAVQHWGKGFLDSINAMQLPHGKRRKFAKGGLVEKDDDTQESVVSDFGRLLNGLTLRRDRLLKRQNDKGAFRGFSAALEDVSAMARSTPHLSASDFMPFADGGLIGQARDALGGAMNAIKDAAGAGLGGFDFDGMTPALAGAASVKPEPSQRDAGRPISITVGDKTFRGSFAADRSTLESLEKESLLHQFRRTTQRNPSRIGG